MQRQILAARPSAGVSAGMHAPAAPAAGSPAAASTRAAGPRALIVKLGSIGDVIMTIPAAAQLHERGFSIDWLASETVAPLLQLYPWINVIAVREAALLRSGTGERLREMAALWRRLRSRLRGGERYAVVATLYYDLRYRLLTLPLRAERRVGLSRTDRRFELLPGRHHTDEYARILMGAADGERLSQLAPVPPPVGALRLPSYLQPAESLQPAKSPGSAQWVPRASRPRIALVPAGARNLLRDDALRRWPVEHYAVLAKALVDRGCEVVLLGGPDDLWASPHFAGMTMQDKDQAGTLVDLTGKLTLVETVAVMESATVTVTHDTGPLHMAGLTSTGIVTVFGPTDPHGRLPRRPNAVALWGGAGFACRPCYDGRDYAPCAHNGCMRQVEPQRVLAEVQSLLQARAAGERRPPCVLAPEAAPSQFSVFEEGV